MTCAVSCGFDGLWVPLRSSKADMASIPGRGEPDRPEAARALRPASGVLSVIRHMFPGRSSRVKPRRRGEAFHVEHSPRQPGGTGYPEGTRRPPKPRYARPGPRTARDALPLPAVPGSASTPTGGCGEIGHGAVVGPSPAVGTLAGEDLSVDGTSSTAHRLPRAACVDVTMISALGHPAPREAAAAYRRLRGGGLGADPATGWARPVTKASRSAGNQLRGRSVGDDRVSPQ